MDGADYPTTATANAEMAACLERYVQEVVNSQSAQWNIAVRESPEVLREDDSRSINAQDGWIDADATVANTTENRPDNGALPLVSQGFEYLQSETNWRSPFLMDNQSQENAEGTRNFINGESRYRAANEHASSTNAEINSVNGEVNNADWRMASYQQNIGARHATVSAQASSSSNNYHAASRGSAAQQNSPRTTSRPSAPSITSTSRSNSANQAGANSLSSREGSATQAQNAVRSGSVASTESSIGATMNQLATQNLVSTSSASANSGVPRQSVTISNVSLSLPIAKRIAELCMSERFADVLFLVGGTESEPAERVPAHRLVLASASPVFAAMFFGPLAAQPSDNANNNNNSISNRVTTHPDKCQYEMRSCADPEADHVGSHVVEVRLPDMEPPAFRSLMQFVYEDACRIDADTCTQLLYGAKKYQLSALEEQCVAFLKQNLTIDNAFLLLTQARLFDSQQLSALCYDMIDKRTLETMQSEAFLEVDIDTLCSVFSRDTLGIREVKLFECARRWAIAECERRRLPKTDEYCRYVLSGSPPPGPDFVSSLSTVEAVSSTLVDRVESQSAINSLTTSLANVQTISSERNVLKLIRFTLMSVEEFANNVAKYSILTDGDVKEIFMFFLASAHNKPTLRYNDQPRRCMTGREQVALRFCGVETRWGYSGTSDKIRFTVNRRIFVIGFGLFGCVHGAAEHRVVIQLTHADSGRVVGTNETSYRSDGTPATFRVTFREPVEVLANTSYIACATISGPDSYFGTKGLRRVVVDSVTNGKVTFQFSYAAGCNNGTSVEDGQVPEIIFYV